MPEQPDALQNPFSREKAWVTFRENMAEAARLRREIREAQASDSASDRELLLKAAEALGRLTDNTILLPLVEEALKARDGK